MVKDFHIGLFATGRGQGSRQLLQAVHEAIRSGRLKAKISFVFSNRDQGEFEPTDGFFEIVRSYGYPLVTHSFRKFKARSGDDPSWRDTYYREVMHKLSGYPHDLCVLAGYLHIFSPEMCQRYPSINLHPAAPGGPVGMWQQVIWELIAKRAPSSGNTVFYVTEEMDKGPTVTYSTFSLRGPLFDAHWKAIEGKAVAELEKDPGEELPLFKVIREQGALRERPLVVETLRAFAEGRVRLQNGAVLDSQGRPVKGIDLTAEIEAGLKR
jgi:phosphoribosylglycinamide formyltransferase-1